MINLRLKLTTLLVLSYLLAFMAGCTVRGGWPRFLRHGEAPGWAGVPMDPQPPRQPQPTNSP